MNKIVLIIFLVLVYGHSLLAGDQLITSNRSVVFGNCKKLLRQPHIDKAFDIPKILEIVGLKNIRVVNLDGLFFQTSENIISLRNLRILSDSTTLEDYLSIDLLMNAKTLQLLPVNLEIIDDIGIYYYEDSLFSKDILNDIDFITPDGEHYGSQDDISIDSAKMNDEYTLKLTAGMVISLNVFNTSDILTMRMIDSGGNKSELYFYNNDNSVRHGIPVEKTTELKCYFIPHNNKTISLNLTFTNDNCNTTKNASIGKQIFGSFDKKGFEYDKYSLTLQNGDLFRIEYSGVTDLNFKVKHYLISSNGRKLLSGEGNSIKKIISTDNYLLVIQKIAKSGRFSSKVTYNFTLEVTPDPNKEKYPTFPNKLENQIANVKEPFSLQLNGKSNYPIKYTSTFLPAKLLLNPTSGIISGTPEIAGIFPISVIVENEYGSDKDNFLLNVKGETIDISDIDKDGVIDSIDMCNDTPLNTCVNNKGCPCNSVLLEKTDYVSRNNWRYYTLSIDHKYTSFNVKLYNLEQDLDLYVREGQKPEHDKFDCRPFKGGIRAETCSIVNERGTIWHLGVFGYLEGNFSIKLTGKIN